MTEVPKGFIVGKAMKAEALQWKKELNPPGSTNTNAKKKSFSNQTTKKQPPKSNTPPPTPPKPRLPVSKPIKRDE